MLLRFRFGNFRSFKEEQELSLVAGSGKEKPEVLIHSPALDEAILPVAGIYGANASGKSNILRALSFMADAVKHSQTKWEPEEGVPWDPFAGTPTRCPSSFDVDFLDDGIRYQYSFSANRQSILDEELCAYPKGKRQMWFTRGGGEPINFGEKLAGDNRVIENLTRPNSLFLSAAAQNNHGMLSPVYRWFSGLINFMLGERSKWRRRTAELCWQRPENLTAIQKMLGYADLGIADVTITRMQTIGALMAARSIAAGGPGFAQFRLAHRLGKRNQEFDEGQESEGTLAYLALLGPTIQAIREGGVICVDELDSSLHPHLAIQILRLFNDKTANPKGAQLIFSTHDTNLLSSGELRRDEIWFTEKRRDGASQLYSLNDFKPRKEESLEKGYLQGRYGAIPFLNADQFIAAIGAASEGA